MKLNTLLEDVKPAGTIKVNPPPPAKVKVKYSVADEKFADELAKPDALFFIIALPAAARKIAHAAVKKGDRYKYGYFDALDSLDKASKADVKKWEKLIDDAIDKQDHRSSWQDIAYSFEQLNESTGWGIDYDQAATNLAKLLNDQGVKCSAKDVAIAFTGSDRGQTGDDRSSKGADSITAKLKELGCDLENFNEAILKKVLKKLGVSATDMAAFFKSI